MTGSAVRRAVALPAGPNLGKHSGLGRNADPVERFLLFPLPPTARSAATPAVIDTGPGLSARSISSVDARQARVSVPFPAVMLRSVASVCVG